MQEAYRSGDPYLAFARQAGAVPADATKASHRAVRERFKHCALGVQYGMGARSLARRLSVPVVRGQELLRLHRRTYGSYWRWSQAVERRAFEDGQLQAAFGWTVRVGPDANPRSVRNFPLQANGAEMLRLACCFLTETGVRVCAPVHDALIVEAPVEDIEQVVATCQQAMQRASEYVLAGFPLRTEAKVVRHPARYMDDRGRAMWQTAFGLLDRLPVARCA
jgi:DNA polymerase-1